MPVFEIVYGGTGMIGQTSRNLTPQEALATAGPRISVEVRVPTALEQYLTAHGQLIPSPVSGTALIDTGATTSCVDSTTIQSLGVNPVNQVNSGTAGGPFLQYVYPAKFFLPNIQLTMEFSQAVGANLTGTGIIALLGRDILARMVFIYSGLSGRISVSY